jgi:hypothetical protein
MSNSGISPCILNCGARLRRALGFGSSALVLIEWTPEPTVTMSGGEMDFSCLQLKWLVGEGVRGDDCLLILFLLLQGVQCVLQARYDCYLLLQ